MDEYTSSFGVSSFIVYLVISFTKKNKHLQRHLHVQDFICMVC